MGKIRRRTLSAAAAQGTNKRPKITKITTGATSKSPEDTKKVVLGKGESRISLRIKKEYTKLGVEFEFGVPKDDVSYEDHRIDCAQRNYEGMKKLREKSEERYRKLEKKTEFHTESLEHLKSQEEEFRRYAVEVEDILKEFDYLSAKTALSHYNLTYNVNFQVAQCLGCTSARYRGSWTHTNFWAKQPGDDQKSLFFAELLGKAPEKNERDKRRVIYCEILNDKYL